MRSHDATQVLDLEQLREVTLDDEDLMRQLVAALIEDTEKQIPLLDLAIRSLDGPECARLAHYSKGACSNLGAAAAATVLSNLEQNATRGAMDECGRQLNTLSLEIDRLRAEKF